VLALLRAHLILHVSVLRVKGLSLNTVNVRDSEIAPLLTEVRCVGILKTDTVSPFAQPSSSALNNENDGTTVVMTEPLWLVR
jgi:hypothetical protein